MDTETFQTLYESLQKYNIVQLITDEGGLLSEDIWNSVDETIRLTGLDHVAMIGDAAFLQIIMDRYQNTEYVQTVQLFEDCLEEDCNPSNHRLSIDTKKYSFHSHLMVDGHLQCNITNWSKGRVNSHDEKYIQMVRYVLEMGETREDRTGTGTHSVFGYQVRFDISDGSIPLLTTKKVFERGVIEELLWFLRGSTNVRELTEKHIHFWDDNVSRETLDRLGFEDRKEGDLGPGYGFQWRHFGAEYESMDCSYDGQGVNQINEIVKLIRSSPQSRRIIVSAWNPKDIKQVALPPCHVLFQLYVHTDGRLDCHMYQRSADLGLGVPFNIASYSILVVLLAQHCQLTPGSLIVSFGDLHIYRNHVNALCDQIDRQPYPAPTLRIRNLHENLEDYTYEDFEIENYNYHPAIRMEMSV